MEKKYKNLPISNATDRIFRILECLSYESLNLEQIAQTTNIPTSSALRFIQTCVKNGYIEFGNNKKYYISTKLFSLSQRYMQNYSPVILYAHPCLQELCYITEETVHLGILSGKKVLYVDKIDSPLLIRLASYIGYEASLHSTAMGKVLLAWLPENVKLSIIKNIDLQKFTKNTIINPEDLLLELTKVQKNGYATDYEEQEQYLYCFSVPIFNFQNTVVATISISIPTLRYSVDRKNTIIENLWKCAESISKKLGNNNYKEVLQAVLN